MTGYHQQVARHKSAERSRHAERITHKDTTSRLRMPTLAALALALVTGCAVTSVDPVLPKRALTMLCIDHNPDAGENYDTEIGALLDSMGIKSRMTGGAFPGECPHRLQTSVSWSNTLIRYVLALELVITEDNRPLGDASYYVGQAYRTPERMGSAASKAKPLLKELLAEYNASDANKSANREIDNSNRSD